MNEKVKPVYFSWSHEDPETVYVESETDNLEENYVKIDETDWVVFMWCDEEGFVKMNAPTREECLELFRQQILDSHYENFDEDDETQAEEYEMYKTCSHDKLLEFMNNCEVDCDSSYAYALVNMSDPPEFFSQCNSI